jgi:glycyl-tRNA synthetase
MYQDEIGTPFCVTIDHDTLVDSMVTVRDRDTMQQERVAIKVLEQYISAALKV